MFRSIITSSLAKSCPAITNFRSLHLAMGSKPLFAAASSSASASTSTSAMPNIADIVKSVDKNSNNNNSRSSNDNSSNNNSSSNNSSSSTTGPIAKHKTPRRRASALHDILKREERDNLLNGRVYPELISGDSVRIEKLPFASAEKPDIITGVIIAKYNKTYDTRIDVLNMVDGVGVKWMIRIYDPLVKSISIIDKRFAYRFKKTKRSRSKLYYLFDKDPSIYQVKNEDIDVKHTPKGGGKK